MGGECRSVGLFGFVLLCGFCMFGFGVRFVLF